MATFTNSEQLTMVSTSKLTAKADFQRPIDPKQVARIAKKWNPTKARPIIVADIDGVYYILDGQHTAAAAKVANNNNDVRLPCIIHKMTYEEAADWVARQRENSRNLSNVELFNSEVESGDNNALNIKRVLNQNKVSLRSSGYTLDSTSAIRDIKYVGERGYPELDETLHLIREIWPYDEHRYKGAVIKGIYEFTHLYRGEFSAKEVVNKISKYPVDAILNTVNHGIDTSGTANQRFVKFIVTKYNYKKRANQLDISKVDGLRAPRVKSNA